MRLVRFEKENDITGEKTVFYINPQNVTDVYRHNDQTIIRFSDDLKRSIDKPLRKVIPKLRGDE